MMSNNFCLSTVNTWLWSSFAEYRLYVQPIFVTAKDISSPVIQTTLRNVSWLFDDRTNLLLTHGALKKYLDDSVSLKGKRLTTLTPGNVAWFENSVRCLVQNGELLLAYCHPLAATDAAVSFVHAKRFVKKLSALMKDERVFLSVEALLPATEGLSNELSRLISDSERALTEPVLPDSPALDFITARNLLSLGFDEAAVIYAGRCLEGVLRTIAQNQKILLKNGDPAWEARFVDILARMQELRNAQTKERMLVPATVNLLQYGRHTRNQVAHPSKSKNEKYREQAILMAHNAEELWMRCSSPGTSFV
jgi:hypothetical protein